jgi:hypothetical protein
MASLIPTTHDLLEEQMDLESGRDDQTKRIFKPRVFRAGKPRAVPAGTATDDLRHK